MKRINCHRCVYYFVTWEQHQPHGCKKFGFKSRQIPSQVVRSSSGEACGFFTPKHAPK